MVLKRELIGYALVVVLVAAGWLLVIRPEQERAARLSRELSAIEERSKEVDQTVALLETMRDGVLPGIRQLGETEEDFPLKMASPENRKIDLRCGLINVVGFDGNCCALVVARCDDF